MQRIRKLTQGLVNHGVMVLTGNVASELASLIQLAYSYGLHEDISTTSRDWFDAWSISSS